MIPSEFNPDVMAQRRKLRMLYEARISPGAAKRGREQSRSWKVGDRVRVAPNSQLGKDFGVEGLSTSGTVTSVKGSANNVQLGVKWDGKKQSRGQTSASSVIKEETLHEAPKGPTKDSWLTTAKVGGLFSVFRVFGNNRDADMERLPRVHNSAQAANKVAQAIAAKTGEDVRKS